MIFRMIISLAMVVVLSLSAAAQEPAFSPVAQNADSVRATWGNVLPYTILPGQRVKITAPGIVSHSLIGNIYTIRPDTVVVVTDRFYPGEPDAWNIPLKNATTYRISNGYKTQTGTGALIGGCFGVALSTAFALVDNERSARERPFPYPTTIAGSGFIGALIGAAMHSERWKTVPNDKLVLGFPVPIDLISRHTPAVGERVRILAPDLDDHEITGWVYALGRDSIALVDIPVFDRKNNYRQIPLDRISRYQISVGKHSHEAIGALAGFCAGFFVGAVEADVHETRPDKEIDTGVMMAFAGSGMIAGWLIGIIVGNDQWETIPMDKLRLK